MLARAGHALVLLARGRRQGGAPGGLGRPLGPPGMAQVGFSLFSVLLIVLFSIFSAIVLGLVLTPNHFIKS